MSRFSSSPDLLKLPGRRQNAVRRAMRWLFTLSSEHEQLDHSPSHPGATAVRSVVRLVQPDQEKPSPQVSQSGPVAAFEVEFERFTREQIFEMKRDISQAKSEIVPPGGSLAHKFGVSYRKAVAQDDFLRACKAMLDGPEDVRFAELVERGEELGVDEGEIIAYFREVKDTNSYPDDPPSTTN